MLRFVLDFALAYLLSISFFRLSSLLTSNTFHTFFYPMCNNLFNVSNQSTRTTYMDVTIVSLFPKRCLSQDFVTVIDNTGLLLWILQNLRHLEVFQKKRCSHKSCKIHRGILQRSCVGVLYLHGWSLLFNKVVGSSLAILFK